MRPGGQRKIIILMDQCLLQARSWASTAQASSHFIFKSSCVQQIRTLPPRE